MRLLLLFAFALSAKIIEFDSFKNLASHVKPDTLLILDIDDTLLITKQMLGCDEWFLHRKNKHGLEKALAEWEGIRHLTEMEIVEPGSDIIVRSLQDQKFCIMGLTTQGLALATRTVQQLLDQGLDLSITSPCSEEHYFTINGHGVIYRKGILFTSGRHKGEAFFKLCETMNYKPKKIIFLNDKSTHIAELETSAEKRGIEFLGLRYSYSDAKKAAFSAEIADIQFTQSSPARLLTDDEARAIKCKAALH